MILPPRLVTAFSLTCDHAQYYVVEPDTILNRVWINGGPQKTIIFMQIEIFKTVGFQTVSSTIYSKHDKSAGNHVNLSVQSQTQFFKLGLVWNTDIEVFNNLESVVIYFY